MEFRLRVFLSVLVLQTGLSFCSAHDNLTVHPKITGSAAQSSFGLQNFLSGNYANAAGGITNWLIAGSVFEDIPLTRGLNHFYDPVHNKIGLTDGFDDFAYPSFRWATEDVPQFGEQSFPWQLVRAYELNALTNGTQAARQQNLEWMMFYLGHIVHLNQDLAVPAHVRNDNHGLTLQHGWWETFIMWTEIYGQNHCTNNPQWFTNQSHGGWSWWQNNAKFQKLEDFWSRDLLRTNGVSALNIDAIGQNLLGLAEFCNGNFISEDSTYGEFFYFHGKHWFQFPSLAYTSQPKLSPYNLADSVDKIELRNHKEGNRLRIRKTGAGINVTNHSALNYLAVKNTPRLGNSQMQVTLTLHDDKVLQEYHDILIPKAVEYSAGILDYFFRGTMDVCIPGYDTNSPTFTNVVLNLSGQDFHGGVFYVFADAANGTRTQILKTNLADLITDPNGSFTNGTSLELICPGPISFTNQYLVVYQGTIGWTNGGALDLVDSNNCVAAARPWIKQVKTYSYQIPVPDPYYVMTITTNLESDDFNFTPAVGNYEVFINFARFDDTGTIGGVKPTGGPSSCTLLNEISNKLVPTEQVTVVGNHLSVPVTATDDPECKNVVGWWEITLIWRAWPMAE
jgi:hypothetical protein